MNRPPRGREAHSVPGIIGVLLVLGAFADTLQAQTASRFYTVPHCRVVDTRGPNGPYGGPALAASTSRTFGFTQCGVSPTARAVALNVTVTGSTVSGYLALYPSGGAAPLSSTINFRTAQTRANNAIVKLGAGALLSVAAGYSTGTAHFIIDLIGYFDSPTNNQPPIVNAGADRSITLPTGTTLTGTASDDGKPNPPATLTYAWSEVAGVGNVIFGTPNALSTTTTFSGPGSYTLRLTVSDSQISRTDDVLVLVNPAVGANVGRFLEQATWGPSDPLISAVQSVGIAAYLQGQFVAPPSGYPSLPLWPTTAPATCDAICVRDNYSMYPLQRRFFANALYGQDQLRQRVAWALHQMFVVSGRDVTLPSWMSPYLQILERNAFGSYRQLLHEITLSPAMGRYLDMVSSTRTNPNENYAREILQLFSIGTDLLNIDGTPQLDSNGEPLPSYDQAIVEGFTKVFTGWRLAGNVAPGTPDYISPMVHVAANHDLTDKQLLNGVILPAGQTGDQDLNAALDNIFYHPNVGPFVSKHLIRHLVTSNPSPAYVARVAGVFNNDGTGARGNLRAVVEAVLMDVEARNDTLPNPNSGHLKEPVLFLTNVLRAFSVRSANGTVNSDGYLNPQITNQDQDVFRPPTVFSYYPADFIAPGAPGVYGPEFGILSASTALRRANMVNALLGNMGLNPTNAYITIVPTGANAPAGTGIDLNPWLGLASNPAAMVVALNRIMMHGAMSPQMQSSLITAINAVPATNALLRVRQAIYLVATSSQYQVQR
ncbi:MAG: DUF1800 family protein [Thermoanaerobaculia bacterium]